MAKGKELKESARKREVYTDAPIHLSMGYTDRVFNSSGECEPIV